MPSFKLYRHFRVKGQHVLVAIFIVKELVKYLLYKKTKSHHKNFIFLIKLDQQHIEHT